MRKKKFKLRTMGDDGEHDTAYLMMPNHPGAGKHNIVNKQIRLLELVDDYKGPDIYLDIDHDGILIGIEILVD